MIAHLHCANPACRRPLAVDHVTLVTTAHVRRFCSVDCIADGQRAIREAIVQAVRERRP